MLHGLSTFLQGIGRIPRQTISFEVYRHGGRWIIGGEEHADGRLVCAAAEERRHAQVMGIRPPRLVALRRDFRRIASRGSIAGLFMCVDHKNAETARLGIWLMGRTRSKSAISEVVPFVGHPDVRLRREAARALRRLGGWAKLRALAASDPDSRVQRLATPCRPKPFQQRFHQLTRSISRHPADAPVEVTTS